MFENSVDGSMSSCGQAARSASAEAQASKAAGGGVTGLVTESGESFVGASLRAGGPRAASNTTIQNSLDGVRRALRSTSM